MNNTPEQLRILATQIADEAIKQILTEAAEQHERMAAAMMKMQVPDAHPEVVAAEPKPATKWLALPWGGVVRIADVARAGLVAGVVVTVVLIDDDYDSQEASGKDEAARWLADIERQLGVTHDGYAPDDAAIEAAIEAAVEVGCPGCSRLADILRACGDSTRVVG